MTHWFIFQRLPRLFPEYFRTVKWGASFRWSFGPNSAWESIGMMTIVKTHPTLIFTYVSRIAIAVMKNLFHHFFIMTLVWFVYFLSSITIVTICRVCWRAFSVWQAQVCFLNILKKGYRKKTRSYRERMNLIFNRICVMRIK